MQDIEDLKVYLGDHLEDLLDMRRRVAQSEQLHGNTLEEGYATADEVIYTFLMKEMNSLAAESKAKIEEEDHWQSSEGVVYYQTVRDGKFVQFDKEVLKRTRRPGEGSASLALKTAKELGYEVD